MSLRELSYNTNAGSDLAWKKKANCLGIEAELFYPERGVSSANAKQVCKGCEVREECLEFAITNGEKFGIWGGLSERERRVLRRERRMAKKAEEYANVISLQS